MRIFHESSLKIFHKSSHNAFVRYLPSRSSRKQGGCLPSSAASATTCDQPSSERSLCLWLQLFFRSPANSKTNVFRIRMFRKVEPVNN
jgi:hypothetical protein